MQFAHGIPFRGNRFNQSNAGYFQLTLACGLTVTCRNERSGKSGGGTWHHRGAHHRLSVDFPQKKPGSGRGIGGSCFVVHWPLGEIHEESHWGGVTAAGWRKSLAKRPDV